MVDAREAKLRAGRGRWEKGAVLGKLEGAEFLSPENEACLAWLRDAAERARLEGRAKVAGYLEAVLEEVAFEVDAASRSHPSTGGV